MTVELDLERAARHNFACLEPETQLTPKQGRPGADFMARSPNSILYWCAPSSRPQSRRPDETVQFTNSKAFGGNGHSRTTVGEEHERLRKRTACICHHNASLYLVPCRSPAFHRGLVFPFSHDARQFGTSKPLWFLRGLTTIHCRNSLSRSTSALHV